MFKLIFTQ